MITRPTQEYTQENTAPAGPMQNCFLAQCFFTNNASLTSTYMNTSTRRHRHRHRHSHSHRHRHRHTHTHTGLVSLPLFRCPESFPVRLISLLLNSKINLSLSTLMPTEEEVNILIHFFFCRHIRQVCIIYVN